MINIRRPGAFSGSEMQLVQATNNKRDRYLPAPGLSGWQSISKLKQEKNVLELVHRRKAEDHRHSLKHSFWRLPLALWDGAQGGERE